MTSVDKPYLLLSMQDPSTPVIITDSSADDSGLRDSNNGGQ